MSSLSPPHQVTRVSGPLLATRACPLRFTSTGQCTSYSSSLPQCGVDPVVTIPATLVAEAYTACTSGNIPGSCTILPGGAGVSNSDMVRGCIVVFVGCMNFD
jgi:hypothetical protein